MHCHHIEYAEPYFVTNCQCGDNTETPVGNDSAFIEHINNTDIHLSEADKQKLASLDDEQPASVDLSGYYSKEEVDAKIEQLRALINSAKSTITFIPSTTITEAPQADIYAIGTLVVNGTEHTLYAKVNERILEVNKTDLSDYCTTQEVIDLINASKEEENV